MVEYKEVLQCRHCENKSYLDVRSSYVPPEYLEYDIEPLPVYFQLQCPACNKYSFVVSWQEGDYEHSVKQLEYKEVRREILYPALVSPLGNLPDEIDREYKAVLAIRNINPNACVVLIGRTLEVVCKLEDAKGNTLSQKISNLGTLNKIPQTLADMAQQLRQIRNLGAHVAEVEITLKDIPIVVNFLEAILEYLYVAPSKLTLLQDKLTKERHNK